MQITVVAVSARQPAWVSDAVDDYTRRMPPDARVIVRELKPEARDGGKPLERVLAAEAARIGAALPKQARVIALDERGTLLSTRELAQLIESAQHQGDELAFVIGGADGLAPSIKSSAAQIVSLSRMTLPHGLARVMLAEQLYRAMSLLKGHPYHRE